jgi:MEMO1 family protein
VSSLPRIRLNLDFMPSPDSERPGLLIRDPYHYSDSTLLIPPQLVECLECFDGAQTELDLRSELVRITGEIQVGDIERQLFEALDQAGFLENDTYRTLRAKREAEFAAEPVRQAIFAGNAYPENGSELAELMMQRIGGSRGGDHVLAVAAPHASPDGGWDTYRAAYQALPSKEAAADKVFVILGTSHYGAPERFGLTKKPFVTPYGETRTEHGLIDELAAKAPDAICMEDYCHAVEHSIEFQVVMLQHLYGAGVRILPILCGPFVKSVYEGGLPEDTDRVKQFFDAAGNIVAREGKRLCFVLGVDLAHMGRRYGDRLTAYAGAGEMLGVEERDKRRIAQIEAGDVANYWSLIQENQDDLKWCGSSPFYTFLKIMPPVKGELLHYHHWQIDPQSVVSFGALRFEAAEAESATTK